MATPLGEARLNGEGRIVVPAAIRRQLGVSAGDSLVFVTDEEGGVRLTTPRALVLQMWARNSGGDAGDSGRDVRAMRDAEHDSELAGERAMTEAQDADPRTDEEVVGDILTQLGLP
jgi:AbrB family looped-hinge helix DNA binding protein